MTKKHFEEVARTFNLELKFAPEEEKAGLHKAIHLLAGIFKRDNERFDKARFLKACGLAEV